MTALRVLVYEGLLLQDLVRQKRLLRGRRLPPVVPIVLYHGEEAWNAPADVAALFAAAGRFGDYVPHCRFVLCDEQRVAAKAPFAEENFAAALFALEQCPDQEAMGPIIAQLDAWLRGPERESLRLAFVAWLRESLPPRTRGAVTIPDTNTLMEAYTMLRQRIEKWFEQEYAKGKAEGEARGKALGKAEGKAEGEAEGEARGKATLVQRLLVLKFRDVPPEVLQRVAAETDLDRLDRWAGRILSAETLDAVFD